MGGSVSTCYRSNSEVQTYKCKTQRQEADPHPDPRPLVHWEGGFPKLTMDPCCSKYQYERDLERYYTQFETVLAEQELLSEPAPANGHPVLKVCLGFSTLDLRKKAPVVHQSYKETRVDKIVRTVFQDAGAFKNIANSQAAPEEAIVDGFPISFWFGFEDPMLSVLVSLQNSRERRRFNYTKRIKRLRERETRRRRNLEGRILTSSMIQLRDTLSSSSTSSTSSSSDSDWTPENGTGEGTAAMQHYHQIENGFLADSDSDLHLDVHAVDSIESLPAVDPQIDDNGHMDDGTPGPVIPRFHG